MGRDLTASIPLRARAPPPEKVPTTGWDNDVLTVWLAFASPVELVFVLGKEGVMDSMQFIYWLLEMLSNWFSSQASSRHSGYHASKRQDQSPRLATPVSGALDAHEEPARTQSRN